MKKLLQLSLNNRERGSSFRADGNTLYIYDVIGMFGVEAEQVVRQLAGMTGDIHVRLNSPGGDVFDGIAIANALRMYDGNVKVSVDGYAASAASTIAIVGDEVEMMPGSMLMIHNAWTLAIGDKNELLQTASLLEKIDANIAAEYAKKSGGTVEDFAAAMDAETWYTAQEAVDAGLASRVVEGEKAQNKWDLSVYQNAPVIDADESIDAGIMRAQQERDRIVRLLAPSLA